MPWSGGNFTRANGNTGWVTDQTNGIGIEAGRHDTQDNDFKDGINFCLAKDGSNSATGNLNLGNNKITALGTATATTDAMPYGMIRDGAPVYLDKTNNRLGINTVSPQADLAITKTQTGSTTAEYMRLTQSGVVDAATQRLGFYNYSGISAAVDVIQNSLSNFQSQLTISTNSGGGLAERMRVTSAGSLCVNTTSADGIITANALSGASDPSLHLRSNTGATAFKVVNQGYIYTGLLSGSPYNNTTGVAANCVIAGDGVLYRSTSSLKYKEDIEDMQYGLAHVLQLRPVTYRGKSEADGSKRFGGLIAEEVDSVGLTEFVQYAADGTPDALAYSNMVALAFNAIKELNAKVEALQAKVAELEK